MNTANAFDRLAEHYSIPAEIARRFGELYRSDPKVAVSLLEQLHSLVGEKPSCNGRSAPSQPQTRVEQVEHHFVRIGNQWQSKDDIIAGSGISDASLHTVLYTTGKDRFESQRGMFSKSSGFRLRPEVFERYRESSTKGE